MWLYRPPSFFCFERHGGRVRFLLLSQSCALAPDSAEPVNLLFFGRQCPSWARVGRNCLCGAFIPFMGFASSAVRFNGRAAAPSGAHAATLIEIASLCRPVVVESREGHHIFSLLRSCQAGAMSNSGARKGAFREEPR